MAFGLSRLIDWLMPFDRLARAKKRGVGEGGRESRVWGLESRGEGRESRVKSQESRVKGRGARVRRRESGVKGRGSRVWSVYYFLYM